MPSHKTPKFKMSEVLLFCFSYFAMLLSVTASANFSDLFQIMWAPDHITIEEDKVKLSLDSSSGCGFRSKNNYLFGAARAQMKLVAGDSAGTVTAFYLAAEGPNHDELDLEFLGNVSGEPYLLQTNVILNGTGDREQRHSLWFDPTTDFHNYSFLWNHQYVLFQVDDIPVRIFENKENQGVLFPNSQPMAIHGSLWNGDGWATQGGRVKINWSHAPFVATFGAFEVGLCATSPDTENAVANCGKPGQFWWDKSSNKELDKNEKRKLEWAQNNHLVYDYCKDIARFTQMPKECQI